MPLSALIFYLMILFLWKTGFIPHPREVLAFLENLYNSYGLFGLSIASFLEGVVYFGLYFPGSFIVALAVILSDGAADSIFVISLVVAITLTITSAINYVLGRKISSKCSGKNILSNKKSVLSSGLLISMIHPNSLAFYFFNAGIRKQNPLKIMLVPFVMLPYGFLLGHFLYSIKEPLKRVIENPYILIGVIFIWVLIAFFRGSKKRGT